MTKNTYEIKTELNTIIKTDEFGEVSCIPIDPGNSDYQAYLESLEPKAKASKVVDEAAPE